MTEQQIIITTDGELAVPFDIPPIEHDPGRHLSTHRRAAVELAVPIVAVWITIGLMIGGELGFIIIYPSFFVGLVIAQVFSSIKIDVYQFGMKVSGWAQQSVWVWWDEIMEIDHVKEQRWMGGLDRIDKTYMELSLYIRNECVFVLPHNIPNRVGLYYLIVRHVEPSLLSYYSRILPEGKTISMGPIRIEQAGIGVNEAFIRWEDIESFEREGGEFILKTSKQTYRLTFKRNQNVLERLFMNAMQGDIGVDKDFVDRTDYVYRGSQIVVQYDLD